MRITFGGPFTLLLLITKSFSVFSQPEDSGALGEDDEGVVAGTKSPVLDDDSTSEQITTPSSSAASTITSTQQATINKTRSLICQYQSCLELAQKVIQQYSAIKNKFPDFAYTITGGKCTMSNIPEGWVAFCEKRVYQLQTTRSSNVSITDIRRGCGFTNREFEQENKCIRNPNFEMPGKSGVTVFNGTETICRCFTNNCNTASQLSPVISFRSTVLVTSLVILASFCRRQ